jgi:Transposase DDE domain
VRKPRQKVAASLSPTSRPRISREPSAAMPLATITAIEPTWPVALRTLRWVASRLDVGNWMWPMRRCGMRRRSRPARRRSATPRHWRSGSAHPSPRPDAGDGFRELGYSKKRRLEPQITIGLLTDATGFPLAVEAFEGNKAETATMVPTLRAFVAAHRLTDITVVADAGMLSDANKREIEAAGLGFILGNRFTHIPYVIDQWRTQNPDAEVPDGLVLTQPWPPAANSSRRDQVIYYQYRHDRARRTLKDIDEQISKAERAVAGKVPVKRNRFITLTGGEKSVNRDLEAKALTLAGWKSYITNITNPTAEFVIGAYRQLWRIEKSFRMSKHDLQAPTDLPSQTNRSRPTWRSCSPRSPLPTRSRPGPAGLSSASSRPLAATAPSPSASATTSSPPKNPYRPSCATPSP